MKYSACAVFLGVLFANVNGLGLNIGSAILNSIGLGGLTSPYGNGYGGNYGGGNYGGGNYGGNYGGNHGGNYGGNHGGNHGGNYGGGNYGGHFGPIGAPGARPGCPLCDSSVYSYCSDKLVHDSCCCDDPYYAPKSCRFTDCSYLVADSCQEYDLIASCCCDDVRSAKEQKSIAEN